MGVEGLAQPRDERFGIAQALDGLEAASLDLADRRQAGANRLAVDEHRAGAAIAGVAADLDAGEAAVFAQSAAQPFQRRGVDPRGRAVEPEGNAGRAVEHQIAPPASPAMQASIARRTSVIAASRR